jgi:hypothetical protein
MVEGKGQKEKKKKRRSTKEHAFHNVLPGLVVMVLVTKKGGRKRCGWEIT